ncbi:DUF2628 domain-containing protein [Aquincola tertiaricarbonis]|uniref:DUF2628 domain-containing protein n=1 Tax=Aquincola tertiaricarbonis TaxID=391953 RepID=A0ABY4S0C0_AQUTE|nr:DUF2628 domain-containing protein [Aquincola tertiaricarbonis]URI06751.1 DUF2628 domain-containing protein [Aquincola tertiaricarbonis]
MEASAIELSEGWKKKFALIEKAGGPALPNFKSLSRMERFKVNFNVLAFMFMPFYFIAKGMWRKGLTLFLITVVVVNVIDFAFDGVALADRLANFFGPFLFSMQANKDYYRKVVLGRNGWW